MLNTFNVSFKMELSNFGNNEIIMQIIWRQLEQTYVYSVSLKGNLL